MLGTMKATPKHTVTISMDQDTAAIIAPILEAQAAGLAAAARRLSHRPGASGHMEEDSETIYYVSHTLKEKLSAAQALDAANEPVQAPTAAPTAPPLPSVSQSTAPVLPKKARGGRATRSTKRTK